MGRGKRNKSQKGKGKAAVPAISSIAAASRVTSSALSLYTGPIWDQGALGNKDLVVTNLIYQGFLSSNPGGVSAVVQDMSMVGFIGWTSFSTVYDEFRVLAMEAEYFPNNRYSKATVICTPGVGVIDRDSNAPLGSFSQAFGYASARIFSLEDPWTDRKEYVGSSVPSMKYKMVGTEESLWVTTAVPAPATHPAIKFYFSGLSASTQYGMLLQRALVQFRGRI
jgi:hypothetical protein